MSGDASATARRIADGVAAAPRCGDRRCLRELHLHRRSQYTAPFQTLWKVTYVAGSPRSMDDLLDEMRQCKSVKACIDLALTDAYGEDEQAVAWLTCIEEMSGGSSRSG